MGLTPSYHIEHLKNGIESKPVKVWESVHDPVIVAQCDFYIKLVTKHRYDLSDLRNLEDAFSMSNMTLKERLEVTEFLDKMIKKHKK